MAAFSRIPFEQIRNDKENNAMNENQVKFWKSRAIDGLELKRATLRNFNFSRHMDERYVVCLVQDGVELFGCRGTSYAAGPGDIVLYHPEDVHDGSSPDQKPWSYRCFYVGEALARSISAPEAASGPDALFSRKGDPRSRTGGVICRRCTGRWKPGKMRCGTRRFSRNCSPALIDRHSRRCATESAAYGGHDRGACCAAAIFWKPTSTCRSRWNSCPPRRA